MFRSILVSVLLLSVLSFAQESAPRESQPATTLLPSDTKIYVDACEVIDKISARTQVRSAVHVENAVRNNFLSSEVGQIVRHASEAEYAFMVIVPKGKQMAVLVPIESYKENVTWLNGLRGEVNLEALLKSAAWSSSHSWNKGRGFALGMATFGAYFGPELKVSDLVTKFKNEMLRETPRSASDDRHDTKELVDAAKKDRKLARSVNKETCKLDRVFKPTDSPDQPAQLPATPIKLWVEPLSVEKNSECVVNLDVRDTGKMKLDQPLANDSRFILTKTRDEADYVLSIIMFKTKNIAVFMPMAVYKDSATWENTSSGHFDLYNAWKHSLWRSNQKNQRLKTAGVAMISYGLFTDSGDKSATELVNTFKKEIAE